MRIAFVSAMASHPWGGSEELWAGAARHLAKQGHVVAACVPGWPERPPAITRLKNEGVEIFERRDVKFKLLSLAGRLAQEKYGFRKFPAFPYQRWLRRFKPDFVCVSNGNFKDGAWCMDFLEDVGIPFVSVVQANAEFLWPKDDEVDRLKRIYNAAKRIYFVSQANKLLLENQLATPLPNSEVVRNPYNGQLDHPCEWPASRTPYKLACVGRLEPDAKGQDLIIQVLARPEWIDRPLHVSFYGEGFSSRGLRRLASMYGVENRIHFHGHESDIRNIWLSHHGALMPSRYEGLPLALVEAALAGRMAIVTDVAGNCEIVEDGVNGFVAEGTTVKSLSDALERSWNQRDRWESMGIAARECVARLSSEDFCLTFSRSLLSAFLPETVDPDKDHGF